MGLVRTNVATNLSRDIGGHRLKSVVRGQLVGGSGRGAHELVAIQAGDDLAGVFRLIGQPDNAEDAAKAANLHSGILGLAESDQVLNASTDFEVAIRREADAS